MKLTRQQMTLLGIFALFFAPLVLVVLMRSQWWDFHPVKLKNRGHLVQPPLPLPLKASDATRGKWLLLYELPERCGRRCTDTVTALRQIHKAAGRKQQRVAIVLLSRNAPSARLRTRLEALYAPLQFMSDDGTGALSTLSQIKPDGGVGAGGGDPFGIFILDPDHRVILAYNANRNPSDINTDLKRLLKWSKQDNTP